MKNAPHDFFYKQLHTKTLYKNGHDTAHGLNMKIIRLLGTVGLKQPGNVNGTSFYNCLKCPSLMDYMEVRTSLKNKTKRMFKKIVFMYKMMQIPKI